MQFLLNLRPVSIHRFRAQTQPPGDLAGRETQADKIGFVCIQGVQRLGGISGFIAHYQIQLIVDQLDETHARDRMTIHAGAAAPSLVREWFYDALSNGFLLVRSRDFLDVGIRDETTTHLK